MSGAIYTILLSNSIYDRVRRVSGLRWEPVVFVKNPTLIPASHWERWSRPCRGRLWPSRCEFCVGVLCTEFATRGSESATRGSGSSFLVGCWDQWGKLFFTETTGSLRNPNTRRTPSYPASENMNTRTRKSNLVRIPPVSYFWENIE